MSVSTAEQHMIQSQEAYLKYCEDKTICKLKQLEHDIHQTVEQEFNDLKTIHVSLYGLFVLYYVIVSNAVGLVVNSAMYMSRSTLKMIYSDQIKLLKHWSKYIRTLLFIIGRWMKIYLANYLIIS